MKPLRSLEWIEDRCEKITETGCWIWMGATLSKGYGCFRRDRKYGTQTTHRTALANVIDLPDELHVLHRCDVMCCCNPYHLFAGTNVENIEDSMAKGRRKGITRNRPSGLVYRKRKDEDD